MSELSTEKARVDTIIKNAQAEYDKIVEIAKQHIESAQKILIDNGIVQFIQYSEPELLSLLKQLYQLDTEYIRVDEPKLLYNIKELVKKAEPIVEDNSIIPIKKKIE